jgi:hypothetical protein
MCIIVDQENIVRLVSFIPGVDLILPIGYKVIFPWEDTIPCEGDKFTDDQIDKYMKGEDI